MARIKIDDLTPDITIPPDVMKSLRGGITKNSSLYDSHDRYSNTDTNYLLTLVENYSILTEIASNLR
jgi:hypothetical protein